MLELLIKAVWATILAEFDEEEVKEIMDAALDVVEDKIEATETKVDDWLFGPPIAAFRAYFDLPDNDEPEE